MKLFNVLGSVKMAVIVLILLVVALATGTILESLYDTPTAQYFIYRAWYFRAVLAETGADKSVGVQCRKKAVDAHQDTPHDCAPQKPAPVLLGLKKRKDKNEITEKEKHLEPAFAALKIRPERCARIDAEKSGEKEYGDKCGDRDNERLLKKRLQTRKVVRPPGVLKEHAQKEQDGREADGCPEEDVFPHDEREKGGARHDDGHKEHRKVQEPFGELEIVHMSHFSIGNRAKKTNLGLGK